MHLPQNFLKYLIGLVTVIGLRLAPHPPNVEPIMATMLPFSKKWGWMAGVVFCLASVICFDVITGTLGTWSLVTAGTYAALGAASGFYFKNRAGTIRKYVTFSILATLVYDAITGVAMGVVIFHQPLMVTVVGQIPFTLNHLGGNMVFSAIISPLLYKWVVSNPQLETKALIARFGNLLPR